MRNRVAEYLEHKPSFVRVAAWSFGVPSSIVMLWMFGPYGGIGWWLLLIALMVPASWLWAVGMWFALESELKRFASASRRRSDGGTHGA